MSWRLRLSVETIQLLIPAVLGSTIFSIRVRGRLVELTQLRIGERSDA